MMSACQTRHKSTLTDEDVVAFSDLAQPAVVR